eukprot:CAMPEP_0194547474 /NCGR_PEP_ID=MMETSP0253-20130528/92216_1 /TAXON_ID=2966 /ORGANISM="Noctiluca scintillans" /LENGTH=137 /DNA_ID=CAMNT_0039394685 /DNA_START=194 /DNA_END=607 /DNA_ORIENTATION=-
MTHTLRLCHPQLAPKSHHGSRSPFPSNEMSNGQQLQLRASCGRLERAQNFKSIHANDNAAGLVDLVGEDTHLGDATIERGISFIRTVPLSSEKEGALNASVLWQTQVQRTKSLLAEIIASRIEVKTEAISSTCRKLR